MSDTLRLLSRFDVSVSWKNPYDGGSTGVGHPVLRFSPTTGAFWFFDAENIELFVKMLDAGNGRFWLFYGSLTDVEFTMTVTDTTTGAVKTYHNEPRHRAGVIDMEAFGPVVQPPVGSATLIGTLPDPRSYSGGRFSPGYADDIAIAQTKLYLREDYGVSVWFDGDRIEGPVGVWDLESRQGYQRSGDIHCTVAKVAVSADGHRILAGWYQGTHGVLVLDSVGKILGEFGPGRALGGVAIVESPQGLVGLALSTAGLYRKLLSEPLWPASAAASGDVRSATLVPGAPGGVESSHLVASGRWAAYGTGQGQLVVVENGAAVMPTAIGGRALAIDGGAVLLTYHSTAVMVWQMDNSAPNRVISLPASPQAGALVGGVAWTAIGSTIYRESTAMLSLDPTFGPIAVMRASGSLLFAGTGLKTAVVRIS